MTAAITTSPATFADDFATNFNARDLDSLVDNYTADAVLDLGGGQRLAGHAQVRSALANFLAAGLPIATTPIDHAVSGDVALVRFNWSINGTAPDGREVAMGGSAVDILRRDQDGRWRQAIDFPFGTAG